MVLGMIGSVPAELIEAWGQHHLAVPPAGSNAGAGMHRHLVSCPLSPSVHRWGVGWV